MSITALAARTGLHVSTVHRLLATLLRRGQRRRLAAADAVDRRHVQQGHIHPVACRGHRCASRLWRTRRRVAADASRAPDTRRRSVARSDRGRAPGDSRCMVAAADTIGGKAADDRARSRCCCCVPAWSAHHASSRRSRWSADQNVMRSGHCRRVVCVRREADRSPRRRLERRSGLPRSRHDYARRRSFIRRAGARRRDTKRSFCRVGRMSVARRDGGVQRLSRPVTDLIYMDNSE